MNGPSYHRSLSCVWLALFPLFADTLVADHTLLRTHGDRMWLIHLDASGKVTREKAVPVALPSGATIAFAPGTRLGTIILPSETNVVSKASLRMISEINKECGVDLIGVPGRLDGTGVVNAARSPKGSRIALLKWGGPKGGYTEGPLEIRDMDLKLMYEIKETGPQPASWDPSGSLLAFYHRVDRSTFEKVFGKATDEQYGRFETWVQHFDFFGFKVVKVGERAAEVVYAEPPIENQSPWTESMVPRQPPIWASEGSLLFAFTKGEGDPVLIRFDAPKPVRNKTEERVNPGPVPRSDKWITIQNGITPRDESAYAVAAADGTPLVKFSVPVGEVKIRSMTFMKARCIVWALADQLFVMKEDVDGTHRWVTTRDGKDMADLGECEVWVLGPEPKAEHP